MYSKKEKHDLITERIISSVFMNHLKNGDKMPSENQLASALDVPRASIREVYGALDIVGIVESRRGEGTFLRTGDKNNNMIFRLLMLALFNDNTDVYEIMELRRVIETGIAEKAALNRTRDDVKIMKNCIREMKLCRDGNRLSELDNILHAAIGNACGNALLCNLSGIISNLTISSIKEHWKYIIFENGSDTKQKTFEQHNEIVEAIVNQKPGVARMVMEEHLDFVSSSLERYKNKYAEYDKQIHIQARISEMKSLSAKRETEL